MSLFKKTKIINVVKLSGIIAGDSKKNLSLSKIKCLIDKAFSSKKVSAVVFVINSPGGSPVQSEMIANYIMAKSKDTGIKVLTFIEDVAASGGYWLALVGEEIYALSKSSIVGSLGVVYASFGLEDFIAKHSINRRVHTAGTKKVSLDMFQQEKKEDIERLKIMLSQVHENFKLWVLSRRENKITLNHEDLFSGEFWVSVLAEKYGLIDGIALTLDSKLKEIYGEKIKIEYLTKKEGFLSRLPFMGNTNFESIVSLFKEEILKSKFGL